jgi:glycosyltransferase involved in cell wall biosynthesis/SAM-dependent methyltransferase
MRPVTADIPILIPAYRPAEPLIALVTALLQRGAIAVVVVDDGSGPEFAECFRALEALPRVHVARHAVNLGKGAALKTGLNHILVHFPDTKGAVTADADGQHDPEDILRVAGELAKHPEALVMGVRAFGKAVPWRSRVGNRLTRSLMHVIIGQIVSDSQTGLRGIPAALIPHLLRLPSSGYEFELDMLLACKHQSYPILEEPIRTIYLDGNKSSHFNPLLDSMRIYLLLFRFTVLSVVTAVLDNAVFAIAYWATGGIGRSQIAARSVAGVLNYLGARSAVFHSQQRHRVVLPKYIALVVTNGITSYLLIQVLHFHLGVKTMVAKISAEAVLFVVNFAIQRDFVFSRRRAAASRATDWDRYYTSVPSTARLTRQYSTAVLVDAMRRFGLRDGADGPASIVEIGGANSCFLDAIVKQVPCRSYDVVDTNEYGLSLLAGRLHRQAATEVRLHQQSVLDLSLAMSADIVFSVGLVEHFMPVETRAAILAHFDLLRPGGTVIVTFPTPTLLYRMTRRLIEAVGMWKFPDERPLQPDEVLAAIGQRGDVVWQKTLWPLLLTQHLIVARKR